MACFALTPLLVPMLVPAAVGDDWVYARSVEILLREGRLHILDLSVVTLLFQIAWGSLFATLFGLSFGVLRLSTFVMTMLGGVACYGLCRELEIAPMPSALAAAAYVFNPLSFVLAYTFMSDPFFTALLVVATYGYVRGLRSRSTRSRGPPVWRRGHGVRVSRPPTRRIDTRGRHCCPTRTATASPRSRKCAVGPVDRGLADDRDSWLLPLACVHLRSSPRADIIHPLGDQCGVGAEFASRSAA